MTHRHAAMAATLAARTDADLTALLARGRAGASGVGGGPVVVDVDGTPVFAKRVPLTDLEADHPLSTANLFDLPLFCQYGVGSPGFGAWRELAANQVTTAAVLSGEATGFPVLHHWRVLPGRPPVAAEHADPDTAALGGHPAVRERLRALAAATRSLVLFFEHIPHPLRPWLADDPVAKAPVVEHQLTEITDFLRAKQLLHMDAHFENMRTDGERIYLTDFGLATSPAFDLSPAELAFTHHHRDHDAAYASMRLVNWLVTTVCGVTSLPARNAYVERCATGDIPPEAPAPVAAVLTRHARAAATLNAFYRRLFDGDLHTPFPALARSTR